MSMYNKRDKYSSLKLSFRIAYKLFRKMNGVLDASINISITIPNFKQAYL